MKTMEFYFDFLSPYSYFAWLRLEGFKNKHHLDVEIYPWLTGRAIESLGTKKDQLRLIQKREFLFRECLRYSAKNKIDFTVPETHPFNPLYA
jgi:2-hydroxychromene-2-carboxylate isomerase